MKRWMVQVVLFLAVSLSKLVIVPKKTCTANDALHTVNNYAYGLKVSLTASAVI